MTYNMTEELLEYLNKLSRRIISDLDMAGGLQDMDARGLAEKTMKFIARRLDEMKKPDKITTIWYLRRSLKNKYPGPFGVQYIHLSELLEEELSFLEFSTEIPTVSGAITEIGLDNTLRIAEEDQLKERTLPETKGSEADENKKPQNDFAKTEQELPEQKTPVPEAVSSYNNPLIKELNTNQLDFLFSWLLWFKTYDGKSDAKFDDVLQEKRGEIDKESTEYKAFNYVFGKGEKPQNFKLLLWKRSIPLLRELITKLALADLNKADIDKLLPNYFQRGGRPVKSRLNKGDKAKSCSELDRINEMIKNLSGIQ